MIRFVRDLLSARPQHAPVQARQQWALARFTRARQLLEMGLFRAATQAMREYCSAIDRNAFECIDNRSPATPAISFVVVAYRTGARLVACLESIRSLKGHETEIVVVDNGGNEIVHAELAGLGLCQVRSPVNLAPSEARNVGVTRCRAPLVCFIDDDAIVDPSLAGALHSAMTEAGVQGIRGRVLPLDSPDRNAGISHYSPGETGMVSPVNTEGNAAFRRSTYVDCGGMDPLLFGHEGLDLSYRIARQYGLGCTRYEPRMVIFHDYAITPEKLAIKKRRHALFWRYLRWKDNGIKAYVRQMKRLGTQPPGSRQ